MTDEEIRKHELNRLRGWYEKTNNPLYVWEAIAKCLHRDDPVPDWCVPYLRETAMNLYDLSLRRDFRDPDAPAFTLSTDQAFALVAEGLLLVKQGKRNAFAQLLLDRDRMKAALDAKYSEPGMEYYDIVPVDGGYEVSRRLDPASKIGRGPRQAQRIVAEGCRLLGMPKKPAGRPNKPTKPRK
jgi:hypothetical protein